MKKMHKVKLSKALDLITNNYQGLNKDVVRVKYEKIIRTLMHCKSLSEASEELGISKPILISYIRPLRMLNLIHIHRGNRIPSFELYIEE